LPQSVLYLPTGKCIWLLSVVMGLMLGQCLMIAIALATRKLNNLPTGDEGGISSGVLSCRSVDGYGGGLGMIGIGGPDDDAC
jgi:hypothetical protein